MIRLIAAEEKKVDRASVLEKGLRWLVGCHSFPIAECKDNHPTVEACVMGSDGNVKVLAGNFLPVTHPGLHHITI
jgi:hypothetical protein